MKQEPSAPSRRCSPFRSVTASSREPPTQSCRRRRCSVIFFKADASTSDFSEPHRSIASPTSTPPSSATTTNPKCVCPAPEIAAQCGEVLLILNQNKRSFVDKLDFVTTVGFGDGGNARERLGMPGRGPTAVVTDLGILRPDPRSKELVLTEIYPGINVEDVIAKTGWLLRVSETLRVVDAPREDEIEMLRTFERRSAEAHGYLGADVSQ